MRSENKDNMDLCICCGEPVPEGRMVCYRCESGSKTVESNRSEELAKDIKNPFARTRESINENET